MIHTGAVTAAISHDLNSKLHNYFRSLQAAYTPQDLAHEAAVEQVVEEQREYVAAKSAESTGAVDYESRRAAVRAEHEAKITARRAAYKSPQ